jgi:hypothetical protein
MDMFSWLAQEQGLTAAALTVRAQTVSPNDLGRLVWDLFFPREDVDSVKLRNITTSEFRPVSDRREWNTRGRVIPLKTPDMGDIEMIPVESFFSIEEKEIQSLMERTLGNQALFRELIGAPIPTRTEQLAMANLRRLEVDAMSAWALGTITVIHPQKGTQQTVSFGMDAARHATALTAWGTGGSNAYDDFLAFLEASIDLVGPIEGAMMRLTTLKAIQADAPQGSLGFQLTRAQVEDRISQDLGSAFRFAVNENSLDLFDDGGLATTRTKVWPAHKVAVLPVGLRVGRMAFAPVSRAFELARSVPNAGIDVRGQTAYTAVHNGGRGFTVECQVNALPIPNEQLVAVIDAGV